MNTRATIKSWVNQNLYFTLLLDMDMIGEAIVNMTAGMVLGMALCPIMMKAIKSIRQSIRVNRILKEILDMEKRDAQAR
jgi:hypothetical protein